jgi:hypothetical protein
LTTNWKHVFAVLMIGKFCWEFEIKSRRNEENFFE